MDLNINAIREELATVQAQYEDYRARANNSALTNQQRDEAQSQCDAAFNQMTRLMNRLLASQPNQRRRS